MTISPRAGRPANDSDLVDVAKLITSYYEDKPNPHEPEQRVVFGT
jgi:phosphoglucomutase